MADTSIRTIEEILKDAGKHMPDATAFGATDMIVASAIIAQAIDRATERIAEAISVAAHSK